MQPKEAVIHSELKSAAIVVTYNHVPALHQFEKAIINRDIDFVIFIDNNSNAAILDELRRFSNMYKGKVVLQTNSWNLGLAKALNIGIELAKRLDCYWIYLLDHDANVSRQFFKEERNLFSQLARAGQKVGIVTCIVSNDPGYLGSKLWFRGEYAKVPHVITSGILTNLQILKENGGLDERLFVDFVDLEFTRRLTRSGYNVYRINRVLVVQDFGRTIQAISLLQRASLTLYRAYSGMMLSLGQGNVQRQIWPLYSLVRWKEMIRSSRNLRRWAVVRILIFIELFESYLLSEDAAYLRLIIGVLRNGNR
ncbi:MAG: glycosyltransferase [archaeon]|nr:glycosyltransferase [archaeon]